MGDDLAARQPGSDRFAFGAGGDEAQQEVVQGAPLVGVELAVQGLGGLRDRSADPAGGLVPGDGEGPPFAAQPGLAQGVGEQREGAGLVLDLSYEQVGESGLDDEAGLAGGSFDGGAQVFG